MVADCKPLNIKVSAFAAEVQKLESVFKVSFNSLDFSSLCRNFNAKVLVLIKEVYLYQRLKKQLDLYTAHAVRGNRGRGGGKTNGRISLFTLKSQYLESY